MCATCGCSGGGARIGVPGHGHGHGHGHDLGHGLGHGPSAQHRHDQDRTHTIAFEQAVLAKNDELAAANRRRMAEHGVVALNLMSSPGAGKTTLLTRTIVDLAAGGAVGGAVDGAVDGAADPLAVSVVEGDQETLLDAERISGTGCRVVQINTGSGCHLDAAMVDRGLRALDPPERSVVFIENVGNLVCPALFDLGEAARVVIASTTEGEDKPLKYPRMFAAADLVVLNKIDLLPYLTFDVGAWRAGLRRVNPGVPVLRVSATAGEGLDGWYTWLRGQVSRAASLVP